MCVCVSRWPKGKCRASKRDEGVRVRDKDRGRDARDLQRFMLGRGANYRQSPPFTKAISPLLDLFVFLPNLTSRPLIGISPVTPCNNPHSSYNCAVSDKRLINLQPIVTQLHEQHRPLSTHLEYTPLFPAPTRSLSCLIHVTSPARTKQSRVSTQSKGDSYS